MAYGEIIMHWDDDDWRASDWICQQVNFLLMTGADITGIKHVHYFSPLMNTFWQEDAHNRNNPNSRVWLNGATLGYWKSYWEKYLFKISRKVKMMILYSVRELKSLLTTILIGLLRFYTRIILRLNPLKILSKKNRLD